MAREPRKPRPQQFRRKKRRPCFFCVEKKTLDYKDVGFVRRFMTDRGKIAPRRMTGCCALHQRMVARMVKRARQVGLVPYTVD
ncbi:30S ribosomal protein S18 [candidate division WOR-1 bacterium DG_54_3]|uniref:Small ribosomal subunit protein bS18 n=1 Tax=candidate division WOR-1 bacterium DG_54_3 TaxID=1703775 RepID=A0A0S7Y191_UNCSA|nr:MAG: 30S ribosomal protein S18 [candidate division WOR-1 bacterium DG_54_3]